MTPTITRRDLLRLETHFAKQGSTNADPVWLVDRTAPVERQELQAFLVACFSYGNRKAFMATLEPFIRGHTPLHELLQLRGDGLSHAFAVQKFAYRFHKAHHLTHLLRWMQRVVLIHGSLGSLASFLWRRSSGLGDFINRIALSLYSGVLDVGYLSCRDPAQAIARLNLKDPAIKLLWPAAAGGSACKRPLMFLRWMVRKSTPDLGLWSWLPASALLVPLDTHLWQLSTAFGWTARKSADFKAAEEVTAALKQIDKHDPVRWDYPLCSLGAALTRQGRSAYQNVMREGVRAFFDHSTARTQSPSHEKTNMDNIIEIMDPTPVTELHLGPHPRGGNNKASSGKNALKKKPTAKKAPATKKAPSAKKKAPAAKKTTAKKPAKPAAKPAKKKLPKSKRR